MKLLAILSILLQLYLVKTLTEVAMASVAIPDHFSTGDPRILASHISGALISYILTGVIPLIGLLLNMWVLRTYQPNWLLTWSIGCARLMWLYFPLGTTLGFLHVRHIQTYLDTAQSTPNE